MKRLLAILAQGILALRYRVRVRGLDEVARGERRGILFLANHPALIDPPVVCSRLFPRFRVRPLANETELQRPGIGFLARQINAVPLPSVETGTSGDTGRAGASLERVYEALRNGDNVLLYPSGRTYRSRREDCRGNSAVERILREVPDVRIVLLRTTGLWGSRFSMAYGTVPQVGELLRKGVLRLLLNGVLFMPKRRVDIEAREPDDFPRDGDRATINTFLEEFFNEEAPPALAVPDFWWHGKPHTFPDPSFGRNGNGVNLVPASIRKEVCAYIEQAAGRTGVTPKDDLGRDLALDSLAKMDIVSWLGERYGLTGGDPASLQTVGDVMLAACGQTSSEARPGLKSVSHRWFRAHADGSMPHPAPASVQQALLTRARRRPHQVIASDQISGTRTYRHLLRDALALSLRIRQWPEERVAILLPASVGALAAYCASLLAGKTPVLLNWTVGRRQMRHALDLSGSRHILTSNRVVERLKSYDAEVARTVAEFAVDLVELGGELTLREKLLAVWGSWRPAARCARKWRADDTAVLLFTSGSEAMPKAVPLSHANLLTNVSDVADFLTLEETDRLMGFLPPFHSFGLLGTMVLPLVLGVPVVYHPDPTQGAALAGMIAHYHVTVIMGTPTFVAGIARRAASGQLDSLKWIVTGAEACPETTYELLAESCPQAEVLEGYGITECSPVVAVNVPGDARTGTVGRALNSVEHAVVADDLSRRVAPGRTGLLLVRGPSIFSGYLGGAAEDAFTQFEGKSWYNTGDRVMEDEDGFIHFRGRSKRFVKVGGEMVSLPAIESVLQDTLPPNPDGTPAFAVEAAEGGARPELVLFTTRAEVERDAVNRALRDGGLSALHSIQRIETVDEIPLLGTGKTDYRRLKTRLESGANSATPENGPAETER